MAQERSRGTEKRERILQSAIRVFAKKGFYNTRVSEIARTAGVADGTIYLYFKNKDDILISIFTDRIGTLNDEMLRQLASLGSPSEKIQRIVSVQLGLLRGHKDLAEVITINLRQSNRFLKQYAAPGFNRYLDIIAGVVQEGQERGEFRTDVSPRVAACSLFGALDGLTLTWVLGSRDADRLARAGQQVAHIFIEGLRATEQAGT
jgi:TetR/AcrR family fatty acid metabolism transcriptional regulator